MDKQITVAQWADMQRAIAEDIQLDQLDQLAEEEPSYFYHQQAEPCAKCGYFCECN